MIIHPYAGYANQEMLHAQARVLEDEQITVSQDDSILRNLVNSYRRFETDEVSHAEVEVRWGTQLEKLITDSEGYIYLDSAHHLLLPKHETTWIPIEFILRKEEQIIYETTSSVMKPALDAEFGVISDIDDTILHTGVTSTLKWRLLVNSILKSSHQRIPLKGAAKFYQLLENGKSGLRHNPFFYISNSPWNIYNYLQAFLTSNEFPRGPLLLRDIGLGNPKPESFIEGNKFQKIQHIVETYPELPFIFIGDAAEIDADIYIEIAKSFKDQIKCIYIRTVEKKSKMNRLKKIIENQSHVELYLMKDSEHGISHARFIGLIE